MTKIVNELNSNYEPTSYSKNYVEQIILEKDKEIERLNKELQQEKKDFKEVNDYAFELNNIINKARKYLTSYESTNTIQQCETPENNKGLDKDTIIEMTNRHLKVQNKLLNILEGSDE